MTIGPLELAGDSRAGRAYKRLRDEINRGIIEPGTHLRENEVAGQLGMSRTPVREALRRLAAEGLVRIVPGRGALVTDLDARRLREIYSVRAVLEGMAAREATTRMSASTRGLLSGLITEMAELVESGDDDRLREKNQQFHAAIAEASGNRYLLQLLHAMETELERFRFLALRDPERRAQAHEEHVALFDAIRHGDSHAAEQLARMHAERALAWRLAWTENGR